DECFFFQAEDGIRDFHVTGVQTCALPICTPMNHPADTAHKSERTIEARITRLEDVAAVICETMDDLMWDGVIPCDALKPLKEFRTAIYGERELLEKAVKP